jgi:hypothetical protein
MVMKVPGFHFRTNEHVTRVVRRVCAAAGLVAVLCGAAQAAGASRPGDKPLLIPVGPLGFQVLPLRFLSTTATMYTVHFLDEKHLLFTFTVRSLLKRLPDAEPDDDDRNVKAVLLELPTGKVLAQTEWRLRDHDRYLWPLGNGRFLLRTRSHLSVIDPLRNLAAGEAFKRQELLEFKQREIAYLTVTPSGDLLSVETLPKKKEQLTGVAADMAALAATETDERSGKIVIRPAAPPVNIYFFRLAAENADGSGRLIARAAGLVGAPNLISLPVTGDGWLDINKESAGSWTFDFVTHANKRLELAAYDTSCAPRPFFFSRSEFLALGCRGSSDRMELSYFNLKGEEPWIAALSGTQVSPEIVAAPAAGRFALGRTLLGSEVTDTENLTAEELASQEISVMQNYDGRVLLKVSATPIQRAGQNFDLSASGMEFAVLRDGNLEVYSLPGLTGKDRKELDVAEGMAPARENEPIRLNAVAVEVAEQRAETASAKAAADKAAANTAGKVPAAETAGGASAPGVAPAALPMTETVRQNGPANAGASSEGASGDTQGVTRKRPSLYSSEYPPNPGDAPATSATPK